MKKRATKAAKPARKAAKKARVARPVRGALSHHEELRKAHLPTFERKPRSSHKQRARWFQARASWPWRDPPIVKLTRERARAARRVPALPGIAKWECVGPTNIGGRMTCIVADPANPDRILAGAAGGGVWRSDDAGRSWQPLWHRRDLNIGALAIDPANPQVVYCGTGEANFSADSYPGVGVYRSANWGRSWRFVAPSARAGLPPRIGAIAVDPFDSRHVRLGGIGYRSETPGGLYTSNDGGQTWTRESFISSQNYWCHAVVFHPSRRGTIYCTVTAQGAKNGIWRTTDGGQNWTQLTRGLPDPARMSRASLAIAPSDPRVLYALVSDEDLNAFGKVLGVFRSGDGGDTWKDVTGDALRREGQMRYNNTIAVHPQNPDHVLCGGVDLHLTRDGGRTWARVTRWNARRGASNYAHADHHALLMPAGAPGRVYDCNDGGLDVSEDGGLGWTNRSNGLAVTMFYDVDVASSNGSSFGGGAQDNGTLVTVSGQPDDFFELLGGDGGWMVYDPNDENHVFASYQYMNIFRFRGADWADVTPPADDGERGSVWMAFIAIDASNPKVVYAGSTRLWKTVNDGNSWKAVSPHFDGSPITAIEVATADPARVYVGTENGGVFRSLDGGASWSANLAGPELPGFTVTRIESHPRNADLVYATVANFGTGHVFRSDDGGVSWRDTDGGQLPDVPHQAVAIQTDAPERVYVCNDVGVFASTDSGATWRNVTRNLPYVPVVDLVYHEKDGTLTAATYGRSIWRIKVRET
jgi:photosystem II stability/assembly factor-like uncharacterized protein